MAYRGTRASTLAPVASSRATASTVSTRMPLEKVNRWPRRVSWRGRYESSATKLARKGNPLKLVFAPV